MNARRDPERLIHAFLMEGQTELADQVFDAVRAATERKRQRVVIGPWRTPIMNKLVPIGLGAAAVVVALVVGIQALGPPAPSGVGGAPSATPAATLSPSPAPSVATPSSTPVGQLPEGPFAIEDQTGPLRITVTIPSSGWRSNPEVEAIGKGEDADPPEAAMLAWSWPAGTGFFVYGDPCHWASTKPDTPATTADDLVAALAAQPSRDASEPVDVTVGGYSGKSITLHVPNDFPNPAEAFKDCDEGNFASYGVPGDEPSRYHQGPGQVDEFWILDVDGSIAIIDAMYRPNTPTALIQELRAIAESATFE
jgi:hypothetical protein